MNRAGQHAEHERKQHLDRRLLGLLLYMLAVGNTNVVGLGLEDAPIETPKVSAWINAMRKERSSGRSVRSSIASSDSARSAPMRTSPRKRPNSSLSGPGTEVTARTSAWSNPRPASTLIISRSTSAGRSLRILFWRASAARLRRASGRARAARRPLGTPATGTAWARERIRRR